MDFDLFSLFEQTTDFSPLHLAGLYLAVTGLEEITFFIERELLSSRSHDFNVHTAPATGSPRQETRRHFFHHVLVVDTNTVSGLLC